MMEAPPPNASSNQSSVCVSLASEKAAVSSRSSADHDNQRKKQVGKEGTEVKDNKAAATTDICAFNTRDMQVLRSLDSHYFAAKSATDITLTARIQWARTAALYSVLAVILYMVIGVSFFQSQTDWTLHDTILFAVYTATSAGLGHVDLPKTYLCQIFDMFYILIGIALSAIMVAQVYQALALESARAQHVKEQADLARVVREEDSTPHCLSFYTAEIKNQLKSFFRETKAGLVLSVALPLFAILLTGALGIGHLEGWNFIEGMYFAVAASTTVGYGDYYPKTTAGVLATAVWLPCNIIFTSIYMGSVARVYFAFSGRNIRILEEKLHRRAARQGGNSTCHTFNSKMPDEVDVEAGTTNCAPEDGDDCSSLNSDGAASIARQPGALSTMNDLVLAVHSHKTMTTASTNEKSDQNLQALRFLSEPSGADQPSLSLRVLVLERITHILAKDIAGIQYSAEVKENTIAVTMSGFKALAEKWCIPKRARESFRATCFEALYYVGERALLKRGAQALLELTPDEFHSIFGPVVAAMGDSDTLEGWLALTDSLMQQLFGGNDEDDEDEKKIHRKVHIPTKMAEMPVNQGTAIRL